MVGWTQNSLLIGPIPFLVILISSVTASLKSKKVDSVFSYLEAAQSIFRHQTSAGISPSKCFGQRNTMNGWRVIDCGNLKPSLRMVIVEWILSASNDISCETIRKSSKSCALTTTALDGDEDDQIHCFKVNQPCHVGLGMLKEQMKIIEEPE